jgi:hypothetical protein
MFWEQILLLLARNIIHPRKPDMHNTTTRPAALALAAISFAFTVGAQADTTVQAVGGGWFSNTGEHVEFNDNYAVGGGQDGLTRNNYFLFDLSSVGGTITAATLRVFNPAAPVTPGFPFGYTSADPTETYTLFDVASAFFGTPLPGGNYVAGYGVGSLAGQAIFNDLGTGTSYGAATVSLADNGRFVEISLNSAGLAALNASGGIFGIGGSVTTLDGLANRESLFASAFLSSVGPNVPQLVISSVPEPSETLLFLAGLGLVGLAVRRRSA